MVEDLCSDDQLSVLLDSLSKSSPSDVAASASTHLEQLAVLMKGSSDLSSLSYCCGCVETIVRQLVLGGTSSQRHAAHKSLVRIVTALLQVRSASSRWHQVAMHCLCVLSCSFPSTITKEVRLWAEECVSTWPHPEDAVLLLVSQEGPSILTPAVHQLHCTLQHEYHPCSVPWLSTIHQHNVLATVIQYCLLISPSRQLQVPIEGIISIICLAANSKEDTSHTVQELPWKMLKVLCHSCGAALLPHSDTIDALLASSLHHITPCSLSLCALVCQCVTVWVSIRQAPSAAFQSLAVSSLLLLAHKLRQALVSNNALDSSLHAHSNDHITAALKHCVHAVFTCYQTFGPDLPELLIMGVQRLLECIRHSHSIQLPVHYTSQHHFLSFKTHHQQANETTPISNNMTAMDTNMLATSSTPASLSLPTDHSGTVDELMTAINV